MNDHPRSGYRTTSVTKVHRLAQILYPRLWCFKNVKHVRFRTVGFDFMFVIVRDFRWSRDHYSFYSWICCHEPKLYPSLFELKPNKPKDKNKSVSFCYTVPLTPIFSQASYVHHRVG